MFQNPTTIVGIGNVEWRKLCAIFCMTRAARALEIACDSRKQKLYPLNRPLQYLSYKTKQLKLNTCKPTSYLQVWDKNHRLFFKDL